MGQWGEGWPTAPTPAHAAPAAPQKLQLVLAPLHSLASRALEQGLPDPGSLLAHSLRQLDRIDSLSEQISFLEEQLGSCECPAPGPPPPTTPPPPRGACANASRASPHPERPGGGWAPQAQGHLWLDWTVVGAVTSDLSPRPPIGSCKKEL